MSAATGVTGITDASATRSPSSPSPHRAAAGLQFTLPDECRDSLVTRFARFREPAFAPEEMLGTS